jgi:transcriptional regulator with XRE-family HTH domain
MNAGRALRVLRAAKGLQQRDVALRAELDQSYVSLIESGKRKASPEAVAALARALGVPVSVFELLAADDAELRGIKANQARELGRALAQAVSMKSQSVAPRGHAHR